MVKRGGTRTPGAPGNWIRNSSDLFFKMDHHIYQVPTSVLGTWIENLSNHVCYHPNQNTSGRKRAINADARTMGINWEGKARWTVALLSGLTSVKKVPYSQRNLHSTRI